MPMSWEEAVKWLRQQPCQKDFVRNCYFDDPVLEAAERFFNSSEWRAVRSFLAKEPGTVLDIGAGRGISSYAFAREGWCPVALEPDPSEIVGAGAIRSLRDASAIDIQITEEWGEKLPFPNNRFDMVYTRQSLHHAKNLYEICREIGRVLKQGGCFIATREHIISKNSDLNKFFEMHPLHKLYGGEYAYRLAEYKNAMKKGGIKLQYVLNPYQSEINLFPETMETIKWKIAKKLKLRNPSIIPDKMITYLGYLINKPGRLYTFVGYKD